MEYKTKVAVLSGLLGVLTLTAVLGFFFSQQSVTLRQSQEPVLAGLSVPSLTGVQIGDVVLTKSKDWALTYKGASYPAASERIDSYLKTLAALQRERLVTSGDGQSFGLEKDFKTVKLLGPEGKVLFELQVGGTNDLGDKSYVRLAGQKEIWQTDRGFARTLDLDFNTWADLSLFAGRKPEALVRLTFDSRIETADKTVYAPFDLVKDTKDGKPKWEDRLTKASTDTMASWTGLVPSFRFGAFAAPGEAPPAGGTLGTLTATWSDGNATVVKIGPADAKNRYWTTEGSRSFWIDDWALGQLLYK